MTPEEIANATGVPSAAIEKALHAFDGDDDHLRDDPELYGGREYGTYDEEAVEDRRRTRLRPLFQDPTDAWAQDQW